MKKVIPLTLLVAGALAFVVGLVWMLEVRLERGDSYPPYSSLRSDPLGTMALFESLARLPNMEVARDYRMANELPTEAGTVYLHLGANWADWEELPQDLYGEVQAFLGRGGRLVVVLNPVANGEFYDLQVKKEQEAKNAATDKNTPAVDPKAPSGTDKNPKTTPLPKKTDDTSDETIPTVSLKEKWGLEFDFDDLPEGDKDLKVSVKNVSPLSLPPQLDWHSGLHFGTLDPAWKVIYSRGSNPVVIERHLGAGTVVMTTDGFFLSNEAMRKERHPDLLAWIIGPAQHVVFDEAHFGIVEMPGVAGLIRRYHLTGLVASFLLLAVLFIWKNFSSLVPAYPQGRPEDFVAGRASSVGFVNLLRRNIPKGELLAACFAEWKKSSAAARPSNKLAAVQAVMDEEANRPARERNAAQVYTRVVEILKRPTFTP